MVLYCEARTYKELLTLQFQSRRRLDRGPGLRRHRRLRRRPEQPDVVPNAQVRQTHEGLGQG